MSEYDYNYNEAKKQHMGNFYKVAVVYNVKQDTEARTTTVTISKMYIKHMEAGGQPALGSSGPYYVGYGFESGDYKYGTATFGLGIGSTQNFTLGSVSKQYKNDANGNLPAVKIQMQFLQPSHLDGSLFLPHYNWTTIDISQYIPTMSKVNPKFDSGITSPSGGVVSETTAEITLTWPKVSNVDKCTYYYGVSIDSGAYDWNEVPSSNINTTSYTYKLSNTKQGTTYKFGIKAKTSGIESNTIESKVVTLNKLLPPYIGNIGEYNPYNDGKLNVSLTDASQLNKERIASMCQLYYDKELLWTSSFPNPLNNISVLVNYSASQYVDKLGTDKISSNKFKIVAWSENNNHSKSETVEQYFTVTIKGVANPIMGQPTLSGGFGSYSSTCFIENVSNIKVTLPTATPNNAPEGTTISYKIRIQETGQVINNQVGTFKPTSYGEYHIDCMAIDSRGCITTKTITCYAQKYSSPSISNLVITRSSQIPTNATISYTLNYSPIYSTYNNDGTKGEQINGIHTQEYLVEGSSWTDCSLNKTIYGLNKDFRYNIQLRISDEILTNTYTMDMYKLETVKIGIALRKNGIGINCAPQKEYALEVVGNVNIIGNLTATTVNGNGSSGDPSENIATLVDQKVESAMTPVRSEVAQMKSDVDGKISEANTKMSQVDTKLQEVDDKLATIKPPEAASGINPNLFINGCFQVNQIQLFDIKNPDQVFNPAINNFLVDGVKVISGSFTIQRQRITCKTSGKLCLYMRGKYFGNITVSSDGFSTQTFYVQSATNKINVNVAGGKSITWIKIEHGNKATEFIKESYGTDFLSCAYYFYRLNTDVYPSYLDPVEQNVWGQLIIPVSMAVPNPEFAGHGIVANGDNTNSSDNLVVMGNGIPYYPNNRYNFCIRTTVHVDTTKPVKAALYGYLFAYN